jgi:hypothetical protein
MHAPCLAEPVTREMDDCAVVAVDAVMGVSPSSHHVDVVTMAHSQHPQLVGQHQAIGVGVRNRVARLRRRAQLGPPPLDAGARIEGSDVMTVEGPPRGRSRSLLRLTAAKMPIWRGQLASEDDVRSRCSVRRERLSRLMVWLRTRRGPSILGLAFTAALGTSRQSSTTRPTTVEATVSPIAADSTTDPPSNPRRLTAVLRCGWDLNRAPRRYEGRA